MSIFGKDMEWKATSINDNEKNEVIPAHEYKVGRLRILVLRKDEKWLLTCIPYYKNYELKISSEDKAKNIAIKLVRIRIGETFNMINKVYSDEERIDYLERILVDTANKEGCIGYCNTKKTFEFESTESNISDPSFSRFLDKIVDVQLLK